MFGICSNWTNLDFDVSDFVDSTQNRPADHWREYMRWKITTRITTFHKLKKESDRKKWFKNSNKIALKVMSEHWRIWIIALIMNEFIQRLHSKSFDVYRCIGLDLGFILDHRNTKITETKSKHFAKMKI